METLEQQGQHEKEAAEQIIAAAALFPGIQASRVELFEDHTGDPSMRITFMLNSGFSPDDDWFRAYNDYSTKLSVKLLHSGLSRFPYTRLESAA